MEYIITKTITDEQLDDMLCSALEGGINYWARSVKVKGNDFRGAEWAHEVVTRGGSLIVTDDDDGKEYTLTLKKVLKGLSLKESLDLDNYDAGDADDVIQLALFGKLIYG